MDNEFESHAEPTRLTDMMQLHEVLPVTNEPWLRGLHVSVARVSRHPLHDFVEHDEDGTNTAAIFNSVVKTNDERLEVLLRVHEDETYVPYTYDVPSDDSEVRETVAQIAELEYRLKHLILMRLCAPEAASPMRTAEAP